MRLSFMITTFTKVIYPDLVLQSLAALDEGRVLRRLVCHIALIEGLKFIAVFPQTFDVEAVIDGLCPASLQFFATVSARAWTQHFFENGVADYWAPKFLHTSPFGYDNHSPLPSDAPLDSILCSNGGGKDSFLVMKTFDRAGTKYGVFEHARSEYGRLDYQHQVQGKLFKHLTHLQRIHHLSVIDDFTDGVMMSVLNPDLRGESILGRPCQVGWPEMVIESLPFMLVHKYSSFVLGNERSADSSQAQWSELDGDRSINHQWLKSFEACNALQTFLSQHLLNGCRVFSLLKPIHDYRIYRDLTPYPHILPDIHSCNITKPWCKKCPKCAYVFANLVAVFGYDRLHAVFQCNLFDDEDLRETWMDLMGLSAHGRQAWECVGEHDETRLAVKRAAEMGCQGLAIKMFTDAFVLDDDEGECGFEFEERSSSDAHVMISVSDSGESVIGARTSTEKTSNRFRSSIARTDITGAGSSSTSSAAGKRKQRVDWRKIVERFDRVYEDNHGIPDDVFSRVKALL